jgi:ABC-type multidrug transport system fused ATPase/permease subunit
VIESARKTYQILLPAERKKAWYILALMVIGMGFEMLGIGMIIPIITLVFSDSPSSSFMNSLVDLPESLTQLTQLQLAIVSMAALIVIYLLKNVFLAFLAWQQTAFTYDTLRSLSERLFRSYMYKPYPYHLERNSSILIRNATVEVTIFASQTLMPALLLMTEVLVLIGISTLLLFFEPLGTILAACFLLACAFLFNRCSKKISGQSGAMRQYHEGLRIQHIQQGLGGIKDVKLLGREKEFFAHYNHHNALAARAHSKHTTITQLPRLILEFVAVTGMAILVIAMIAQKKEVIEIIPLLGFFAMATVRLLPSINRVIMSLQSLRYTGSTIDTLHHEITHSREPQITQPQATIHFNKHIRIHQLSFHYDPNKTALRNISLSIAKGESVGFMGASGSGKSTLIDLIIGLLTPTQGSIEVDGQNIQQNIRSWQNLIGYVPQSIYLTDDTIRRNIAFGLADELIDEKALKRAIHQAKLEDFIKTTPDGLETLVGEKGIKLSGGQLQRVGIARALYHNPDILVLDEATSALDHQTESAVMQAINQLQGTKTIIIVAHRLSTLEHCDRVYHLRNGEMVDEISSEHPQPASVISTAN